MCRLRWSWGLPSAGGICGGERRLAEERGAALATLWLAALCPFMASYAGAPLTETPTLFAWRWRSLGWHGAGRRDGDQALALHWRCCPGRDAAAAGAGAGGSGACAGAGLGLVAQPHPRAIAGGLNARDESLAYQAGPVLLSRLVKMGAVCVVLPFGVWTARNWRTFHVFEPLAPRYANDPGEDLSRLAAVGEDMVMTLFRRTTFIGICREGR